MMFHIVLARLSGMSMAVRACSRCELISTQRIYCCKAFITRPNTNRIMAYLRESLAGLTFIGLIDDELRNGPL